MTKIETIGNKVIYYPKLSKKEIANFLIIAGWVQVVFVPKKTTEFRFV